MRRRVIRSPRNHQRNRHQKLARRFVRCTPLALVLLLGGCAGANFGSDLSARPRPQPLPKQDETRLQLPADRAFSITLAPSSREPGLGGKAEVHSSANSDGQAHAKATVQKGGSANAMFQIGHAFQNDTPQQADLDFKIAFDADYHIHTPHDSVRPEASVGLKLYARDGRGRLLRNMDLIGHTSEKGNAQRSIAETLEFTLTLAPGESVDVYLAGQVRVEVTDDRSGRGELRLRNLSMQIVTRLAPKVRKNGDE